MERPKISPIAQGQKLFLMLSTLTGGPAIGLAIWEIWTGRHLSMSIAQGLISASVIIITRLAWAGKMVRWGVFISWLAFGLFSFYQAGAHFEDNFGLVYVFAAIGLGYFGAAIYYGYDDRIQAFLREKMAEKQKPKENEGQ